MTDLNELLTLIKLLRAEGVKEYTAHGVHLAFHPSESPRASGHDRLGSRQDEVASQKEAADPQASLMEEMPVLRKLNPNYAKLTGVSRRG